VFGAYGAYVTPSVKLSNVCPIGPSLSQGVWGKRHTRPGPEYTGNRDWEREIDIWGIHLGGIRFNHNLLEHEKRFRKEHIAGLSLRTSEGVGTELPH
jgi:hypothetical protein